MPLEDARGVRFSGSHADALDHFERALDDTLAFRGDPIGHAEAALAADPDLVAAELLKAHVFAFSLHPGMKAKAEASLEAARSRAEKALERERQHMAALEAWLEGDFRAATRRFEDLLNEQPRDLMALMFAHQADFFAGREDQLLARPERTLAAWAPDLPGRGYILGMRAFGLEEQGRFAEALEAGHEAVAANPRDAWAIHAVAHVHEMRGEDEAGIAWYETREPDWAEDSFFSVHNFWHLALYHIDRGDREAALAVYDRGIRPDKRSITLNLCDAASLLWRLELWGEGDTERWQELADLFARHAGRHLHIFNDVHAMLAMAGAGRAAERTALIERLERLAAGKGDYASMLREAGLPIARGIDAFARERYADAVEALERALPRAHLMTGSRAQRDVVMMTLIEAAIRAGEDARARALLEPRLTRKPASRRIRRDLARTR